MSYKGNFNIASYEQISILTHLSNFEANKYFQAMFLSETGHRRPLYIHIRPKSSIHCPNKELWYRFPLSFPNMAEWCLSIPVIVHKTSKDCCESHHHLHNPETVLKCSKLGPFIEWIIVKIFEWDGFCRGCRAVLIPINKYYYCIHSNWFALNDSDYS